MRNIKKYTLLKMQIDELNTWFDVFLNDSPKKRGPGAKLDYEDTISPLWQEYNEKYKLYMKIRGKMQDMERESISN